jgi:hypothetical protein
MTAAERVAESGLTESVAGAEAQLQCCLGVANQSVKKTQPERKGYESMRATIALFVVGLLSTFLLGCTAPGRAYDDAKVALIKKDVTTEADLLGWFGPASTRAMAPDGTKMLSWKFPRGQGRGTGASGRLEVKLDTDGKVTAYSASAGAK